MSESIEVSRIVPASAEAIYKAWLSGSEHGQMTGSTATYNDSDDTFTAWEGYISGKTLEKEPFSRIVQAWRTTEFLESDPEAMRVGRRGELDYTVGGCRFSEGRDPSFSKPFPPVG